MKRLVALFVFALMVLPAIAAEDFSGKWSGTFSGVASDGTQVDENIYAVLVHKGAELTGTAGPSAEQQWKIEKGKVDGNKMSFEVVGGDGGGIAAKLSLAFADGHLKGEFSAAKGEEKLVAKVDMTRVK